LEQVSGPRSSDRLTPTPARSPHVRVVRRRRLANLAAALAVLSLVRGVRFERWEPSRSESGQGDHQPA